MRSYLKRWLTTLVVCLTGAVALNYWVDPYGLYHPYSDTDWKPHAATEGALVKPYQVLAAAPNTVILGNSRSEVGFDPNDSAWPEQLRPVYDLALPGTGPSVAKHLLEHVIAAHPPKAILLGVDFMDFLTSPTARPPKPRPDASPSRLLTNPDGTPNTRRWLARIHDAASTLLSLDAVWASIDTLRLQGQHGVAHLTAQGFPPMHDYERMARQEGYFALFRQRDTENLKAYQRRPRNLYVRGTTSSPELDDIAEILGLATSRHIQVYLVIYPYHVNLLEILRETGFWNLFEEWKRELCRLVAPYQSDDVMLWDFSGYHKYAREPVPGPGDRKTVVRWYWEAGHFKSQLGHQILARIFRGGDPSFGQPLRLDTLSSHLAAIRQQADDYRQGNRHTLAALPTPKRLEMSAGGETAPEPLRAPPAFSETVRNVNR